MAIRPRIGATILTVVGMLTLAACGTTPASPGTAPASAGPTGEERLHRQADQALARYASAVKAATARGFVPVGDLTGQIGDWEAGSAENNKIALLTGHVTAQTALPPAPRTDGHVVWPDGTSRSVTVMSAHEALQQLTNIVGPRDCGGCTPLQVTGAELITQSVQTSRGTAQAPAWAFTLKGTHARVTRVAVRPDETVTVTPPPWDSDNPPDGIAIDRASLTADGVTLAVTFIGSPGPASEPCGADYSAEPVESDTAVVVIVHEQAAGGDQACAAVGATRTASAVLSRPLGARAVLEVRQGTPVPVTTS